MTRIESAPAAIRTARDVGGLGVLRELINQRGDGQVLVIDGARLQWRALVGDVMAELAVRSAPWGRNAGRRDRDTDPGDRCERADMNV
jgi:hypothetical protein